MSYKIPLFDLNFDDREVQAVAETIKDNWISNGPLGKTYEDRFVSMLHVNHTISSSNFTGSLHLVLKFWELALVMKLIILIKLT